MWRRGLQVAGTSTLEFVTVATLEFSQDPGIIEAAFTNAVTETLTVETMADIFQTPELTEKYGQFEVIGTETGGTVSTRNPTASPTRPPTGKAKKAKSSKKSKESKKGKGSKKSKASKKGKESKKGKGTRKFEEGESLFE